jgi:hypothetical protein
VWQHRGQAVVLRTRTSVLPFDEEAVSGARRTPRSPPLGRNQQRRSLAAKSEADPPRGHVPGVDDRERHDDRLGAGPQIYVLEQVVRELPDREDVGEVEEQLELAILIAADPRQARAAGRTQPIIAT